jgi:uncharacterized protein (DUF58 family)
MIRQRIIYVLALIGSAIFYLSYQEWFSWVLLLVVVFFPWLSLILSVVAMRQMRIELNVPATASMGSAEEIKLKISYKLPLPPYNSKILITKPLTGEHWKLNSGAKLPTEHCGKLHVQMLKPAVYDYLGIFHLKIKNTNSQTVLILPDPVEMDIPESLFKYLHPRWRRKLGGGFGENHEIRQYHPGDNLNQIHWKLSAKAGELMLREPMEPERGQMLLTMDQNGTAAELDRKLGRLLWLGQWLLDRELPFDLRVLTANGTESWTVREKEDVDQCIISLLDTPFARKGSLEDEMFQVAWRHHIGGEPDEA